MDKKIKKFKRHYTPQEIWKLIHVTSEQMKETDRKLAETDRILKESKLETDRVLKESRMETDRKIAENDRILEESQKKYDQIIADAWALHGQTEKKIQELKSQLSHLDNNWGRFLEELCAPAALELFKQQGINITQRYQGPTHQESEDGLHEMEVDVILCNTTEAVAVEVKNTLRKDDIDRFRSQMAYFKEIFHPFRSYKVYAAIAAVNLDRGLSKYALRQGFYVIECSGEGVFKMGQCPTLDKRLQV